MPILYLTSLWNDVVARMSGFMSLAFSIAGIYSTWFSGVAGMEHAKNYFWAGAIICFIFANYKIWANEHNKRIAEMPKPTLTAEHLNFEYDDSTKNTMLILAISVINKGAPSVLRGWHASFLVNGAEESMAVAHVQKWIIRNGNETVTIGPGDQIGAKTGEGRVETGEGRTGRIFFTIRGDKRTQLNSLNFRIRVGCFDFLGKEAFTFFTPSSELPSGVPVYPLEKGEVLPMQPESASDIQEPEPPAA
jgi:hypothetical protein